MSFHVPEKLRIKKGSLASTGEYGNCGAFQLRRGIFVIASDGLGWEHVSASKKLYPPTWDDMCYVKALFWDDSD